MEFLLKYQKQIKFIFYTAIGLLALYLIFYNVIPAIGLLALYLIFYNVILPLFIGFVYGLNH